MKPFPTDLPQTINPEAGPKRAGVETHRNLNCHHYDNCLDEAVRRGMGVGARLEAALLEACGSWHPIGLLAGEHALRVLGRQHVELDVSFENRELQLSPPFRHGLIDELSRIGDRAAGSGQYLGE